MKACIVVTSPLLVAVVLLESSAFAQPVAVQPLPVDTASPIQSTGELLAEYVRVAVEKSPTLAALKAKQDSARELVSAAGALPDPMVGIMVQSMGAPWQPMAPMSMVQGEITQAIPGIGKRQARRNAAEAEASVRQADLPAFKSRIAAEVRSLFAQIYATDQERQALKSASDLIDVMVGAIAGQYAAGRVDQEALAKAELERSKLQSQLIDLRTNRVVLVARLNRLLVRAESIEVPRLDSLPEVAVDVNRLSSEAVAQSPELRAQRAAIAAAHRRRENAETETRPNFLVGLAGGATTSGEPIVTLRLGMELPLWSSTKQLPLARSARSDVVATEGEYRAIELRLRSEFAELAARFKRDSEQIMLYRDAIIPHASLALQAARSAYSTGRADFATVIEDFRLWLDAQVGLSRREADRLMTWAELRAIADRTQ